VKNLEEIYGETGEGLEIGTGENTGSTDSDGDTAVHLFEGNTTFGELKSWGLSTQQIEEIIGMPIGGTGETMRDFFSAAGVEFSSVKARLQEAVDGVR